MRSTRSVLTLAAAAVIASIALAGPTSASEPPSHTVAAPAAPGTVKVTWTGTIPPGVGPTSSCNAATPGDSHDIELQVPDGLYNAATSQASFKISWEESNNDEVLTVNGPDGERRAPATAAATARSSPATTSRAASTPSPRAASPPRPRRPTPASSPSRPPSAPSRAAGRRRQGPGFSASVPADPSRDEAEPDMRVDGDGNVVTCGPTGFTGASDYAQLSSDGGDQFHLLGEEPRGQQGSAAAATAAWPSASSATAQNKFQYAYAGLGPLTGFTTSTSPDNGHTITTGGPQGNTNTAQGGGADRQWMAFLDDKTVLLSYNQQQPRNIVVQKSTDGGLTYLPGNDVIASPNPDFPGPMRSMPASLVNPGAAGYVAYYGWNSSDAQFSYVNFAISDQTGLGWHNCLVAKIPVDQSGGLGAFTVADNDRDGNVYLTYSDKKDFHSYLTTLPASKLRGCTDGTSEQPQTNPGWSKPVVVDRGNVQTTVFPWLAAGGAPGRVAVAFYGTETRGRPELGLVQGLLGRLRQPVARRAVGLAVDQPGEGDHAPVPLRLDLPARAGVRPRPAAGRPLAGGLLRDRLRPEDRQAPRRLRPGREEARRGDRPHRHPRGGHPDRRAEQRRRHGAQHAPGRARLLRGPRRRRDGGLLEPQLRARRARATSRRWTSARRRSTSSPTSPRAHG